jgi:hypothetical protein
MTRRAPVSQIGGPFNINRHGLTELPLIEFQVQAWELAWTLVRKVGTGTRFASCSEAGVRFVELETQLASEPREKYTFPCEDGEGITQAIRTGLYTYQLRLLGAGGEPLYETLVTSYEVEGDKPALIRTQFELE